MDMALRHALGPFALLGQITRDRSRDLPRARRHKELEKALGYKFRDQDLLSAALTHASVRTDNPDRSDNERLEFLGDRVLGLAVADWLNATYPDESEGRLARRFNQLVCRSACAEVARAIGLGDSLILSASEADSGGREKDTILADAMEAVLGAVFREAGFDVARALVQRLWSERLAGLPEPTERPGRKGLADAKTRLQEWAQSQGFALPRYREVERKGPDHAPHFTTEVSVEGHPPARGTGASKKSAEQAAAAALLARTGVWSGTE